MDTAALQVTQHHHAPASMLTAEDRALLASLLGDEGIRFDEPMSRHTTLRIGGPADALVQPGSIDELCAVVRACAARAIPVIAVGAGSNLLVRDGGVRGVVLGTRRLRGLEFLGGVPGSVGGGMRMNAGTYLGEFKDVTSEVTTVRSAGPGAGEVSTRPAAACGFAYRHSAIPADEIVVSARLALRPRPRAEIEADVASLRARRKEREPKKVSNAGSIFKNPPGDYAGRLIEACGLKGTRIGDAECSPAHANWLVNVGNASARDLLALVALCRTRVQETHGIHLEMEVKVIGDD
jgi:UDP-N-acetylmuramate dehydrogenase